uniref:Neprilysin n=1 Tax=Panagrellus redivivus TaxID=6233 RepID=A0A7E4UZ13_PANRE
MVASNKIGLVVGAVAIAAVLGVSIVTLVKVFNLNKDKNNSNSVPIANSSNLNNVYPAPVGSTQKYREAAQYFEQSINTSFNPCNDFYGYACGNFKTDIGFDVIDAQNAIKMANALAKNSDSDPRPLQLIKNLYQSCINKDTHEALNSTIVIDAVNGFMTATGIPFPLIDGTNTTDTPFPDAKTLAKYVGTLSGSFGVDTLFQTYVDTNWVDPKGHTPYILYFDQSSLTMPWTYYIGDTWTHFENSLYNSINTTFSAYADLVGVNLDSTTLGNAITDIVQFEYLLANSYMTDDKTRWQNARSYNPTTIAEFNAAYNNFDVNEYLTDYVVGASDEVKALVKKPSFYFSVFEPNFVSLVNTNLTHDVTVETLTNYLNFRLLYANQGFYISNDDIVQDELIEKGLREKERKRGKGRPAPRGIRPRHRRRSTDAAITPIQYVCVDATIETLQYANARIFIDALYPTPEARELVRSAVSQVVEGILIGMQSMIDQLWWMSASSKKGAYEKIQNLVRNIAYPDFVLDDGQLSDYYEKLGNFSATDNYYDILNEISAFNTIIALDVLLLTNGTNRKDWNGPPGIVNAWYQPELNSISFPAAILQQPFFDAGWPASVNYGAMGVVAGHELSHGFDSSGTQWDGFGELITWLDPGSQAHFDNMTACVINEYNGFCPLSNDYAPRCLNGQQTVGENVADNGGIHSAFRAYRNAINFNGLDPVLPGSLTSSFTHDQLFFLSFAQVWCEPTPRDSTIYRQILTDPHSPSKYRVFGTIQNFPAFKNAFNCPADSTYAPADHCNVWISEVNITDSTVAPNQVNVANPDAVKPDAPQLYTSYSQAEAFLRASINFSVDPCENFWQYACGAYQGPVSFTVFRNLNYKNMATALENLNNGADNSNMLQSEAIKKTLIFYNTCKKELPTLANDTLDGSAVNDVIEDFKNATGIAFNWFDGADAVKTINSTQLAQALAYLSVNFATDTLLTPFVDVRPNNDFKTKFPKGFVLYIDQNTVTYSKSYYQEGAWNITEPDLSSKITTLLQTYAAQRGENVTDLSAINKILTLEQQLANVPYSADDTSRRNYVRWTNNTKSVKEANGDAKLNFIDWNTYVSSLAKFTGVDFATDVDNYNIMIAEYEAISKLPDLLKDSDLIAKYLYYRLLASQSSYINVAKTVEEYESIVTEDLQIGRKLKRKDPFKPIVSVNDNDIECARQTLEYLQYANARFFTEFLYPTADARTSIDLETRKVINAIKSSMHNMLEDLSWISADKGTLAGARSKISDLQINVAFPSFVLDNKQLDAYHAKLDISETDNYVTLIKKLTVFNSYQNFVNLTSDTPDRSNFLGPPGTVNAWYQPELNSITIPEGILQQPYFDPQWPASMKFGAIGLVVGHEITHGFDDEGVQWNGVGQLVGWMSDSASESFQNMTKCVVDEYDGFCPLNASFAPNCLNGQNTLGENTADNGGIHSAYNAYQKWVALNGPDPQLPGRVYSQFSHDQLFFLSFAQVWCQPRPKDETIYTQILVDPHSPSEYRVFGTVQNFPAFRRAFNCPVGSAYAPQDHCNVWVPSKTN